MRTIKYHRLHSEVEKIGWEIHVWFLANKGCLISISSPSFPWILTYQYLSTRSEVALSSRCVNLPPFPLPTRRPFASRAPFCFPGAQGPHKATAGPPICSGELHTAHDSDQVGLLAVQPLRLLLMNSSSGQRAQVVGSELGGKVVFLHLDHANSPKWQYPLPLQSKGSYFL